MNTLYYSSLHLFYITTNHYLFLIKFISFKNFNNISHRKIIFYHNNKNNNFN